MPILLFFLISMTQYKFKYFLFLLLFYILTLIIIKEQTKIVITDKSFSFVYNLCLFKRNNWNHYKLVFYLVFINNMICFFIVDPSYQKN